MDRCQPGPPRHAPLPQLLQHLTRCWPYQSPLRQRLALDTTLNSLSLPAARRTSPAKTASPAAAPRCRSPNPAVAAAFGRPYICSAARFSPRRRGSIVPRDTARSAPPRFFLRWLPQRKNSPLQPRWTSQRRRRQHFPPLPIACRPVVNFADSAVRKFVGDSSAAEEPAACKNGPKRKESATI